MADGDAGVLPRIIQSVANLRHRTNSAALDVSARHRINWVDTASITWTVTDSSINDEVSLSATGTVTSAMTLISDKLLGADGNVSFTSIPGTYTHLQIVGHGRSAAATNNTRLNVKFNADAGSNYDNLDAGATGAANTMSETASQAAGPTTTIGFVVGDTSTAGRSSSVVLEIPDYASTTFWKTMYVRTNAFDGTNQRTDIGSLVWKNTVAITQIDVGNNGDFSTGWKLGSRFSLYGIK